MVMYLVMLFAIKNPEEGLWLYNQPAMKIVHHLVLWHAANHSLLQVDIIL